MRTLADSGVRTVFGVPGGSISAVYDALLDEPRIQVINVRHECSAVFAAAAFARMTGSVGIVLTTSGPGVTNTITGIASAFCDGLPIVVIGGEVPRKNFGRGALQEGSPYSLNLVGMLKHVTKWASEVTSGDGAVSAIRKAMSMANSGRKGPVFLSLPLDVQGELAPVPRLSLNVESRFEIDRSSLDAAVQALVTAKRPMILAGSGCRWDKGAEVLRQVAERYQVPVATTPKGKGVFPETHPLSLGIFGHGGHPSASEYLDAGIDVLLAVGTSFGDAATNSWTNKLKPSRCSIHVDIDSSQVGRNYQVDLGLVGSANRILGALAELAPPLRPTREVPSRRFFSCPQDATDGDRIKPQRALWELQQLMPTSTVYTCDIGDHMMWTLHFLTVDRPDGFMLSSGLAAMGSSLGMALGVKAAQPDRPVVAICGDGTLGMAAMDIADAVASNRRVIYFVMNDERYGMVESGHEKIYGRTPEFPVKLSIGELARGLGAEVLTVQKAGDLVALGSAALLEGKGPLVLDVQISKTERLPMRPRFDALKDVINATTRRN
ncbi:MAG: thiamine pyrophosphate-binding protein [Myxococcaceae bacterium]|nr:thiamine pyrophosphate-binding protein [Myxococcaceae bacterium]